jgi:hypothetical protein
VAALAPLALFIVWIGVAPAPFLKASATAVTASTQASSAAFAARVAGSDESPASPLTHTTDHLTSNQLAP